MGDAKARGSVINGYAKYIKKTWGDQGLMDCMLGTGLDVASFQDKEWYDVKFADQILVWIGKEKGIEHAEDCCRNTVNDLGLLSYIVGQADIQKIFKRLSNNYKDAFNYGNVEVELHPNSARILMSNMIPHKYSCIAWVGFFKGVLDISNKKGTVEETKCVTAGAPHCEFVVKWD